MRLLNRNLSTVYYATFTVKTDIPDSDGLKTGEKRNSYSDPVEAQMSVSAAKGEAAYGPFGADLDYTKIVITDDMTCPIDEHSVMWIGASAQEPHNYEIVRVAKSLNHITYAVKEVDVS